ncbi:band 4.1-like protein 3a isoform X6 [Conger conger]|uniref:band 4.1-like protein 3a isoform X6 n=1 Tax=Conger conger TaxID=82655 RepID=UPI002A5A955C|nr:band 4.1-like protein 3a isoform X6 [Conger conger]
MTTEPGEDSKERDQQGSASQPAQAQPPNTAQPAHIPPLGDEEQFPAAAAHSTPTRKDQNGERGAEGTPLGKHDQFEDDKASPRSSTSKLSKSPGKTSKNPRNMQCKITLLDGSDYICVVEKRSKGQVLFDKVCDQLNLLEKDYFGITFRDMENQKNWVDPAKEMKKQIRSVAWNFSFNVKFYPPDPAQLSEDITRYYLCLQLRDDVVLGRLPCSFATHTVLGSYTVQSELGDYDPEEYGSDYVSEFRFAPNQTKELEEKVMDLHKNYKGMTPAEAEMHFLENAKKLSMYGVDLHHAKDSEGVEIMLGVCASGLLIYRDRLRINRFAWPKVLKISYKRNNFYIKIRPGEFEQFESTIGFKLPNHRAAKRLWKVCVEHHTFFRLVSPEAPPKKFLTLGSKFRYSGRTQAQTRRASSQIVRPAPYFERSSSKRYTMSRSLDGAQRHHPKNTVTLDLPVTVNDSNAQEMGTGQYGTTKGIATSDLITTVTPEKKVEEEKAEKEDEEKTMVMEQSEVSEPIPTTPVRQDMKTDSEWTETIADGETTATESDQEDESEMKTQETKTPEELMKYQTNISELKRTFLETGADTSALTEWEKRLSTSPVRSPRLEEAPMIEPLVPDEAKHDAKAMAADILQVKHSVLETRSTTSTERKETITLQKAASQHQQEEEDKQEEQEEEKEEQQGVTVTQVLQDTELPPQEPVQSLVFKTEAAGFSSITREEREELVTKEHPVINTETKTITYESSQKEAGSDADPGILMSAQTITSETTSTTTTTHITKTVKGGLSETRIEKRIVITGDADIDHDQALAQAIKEAKEQHPDMSVTKVVVHKETEVTPEEGEE